MKQAGKTQNEIAQAVGCSQGTISKELSRNRSKRGYRPSQAQRLATERKTQKRTRPRVMVGIIKDEVEARLFGWHQRSDPRLLQRNDPFGVNHWVGGAVGVVRDEKGGVPKWDELLKCKCDIDATLQELLDNRLVWNEARFCFVQERDKNLGGNSLFRSEERIATEKRYLKRKWKAHIRMESYKSQDRVSMDAPRRQSVKL